MATANLPKNPIANWEKLREEWLSRLSALMDSVQTWAQELGWSTRRIDKPMEDSQIGNYRAPALLLQQGFTRILLEPIARFAVGTEGVVDLYLMPAYDDLANLFFADGGWQLHYVSPGILATPAAREIQPRPLSRETIREVLQEMQEHAARLV